MIVCIGNPSVDTVTLEGETQVQSGGASIYSAISASTISQSCIVGSVGNDYRKDFLDMLESQGIDISHIRRSRQPSKHFTILIDNNLEAEYPVYDIAIDKKMTPSMIPPDLLIDDNSFLITQMSPKKQMNMIEHIRSESPKSVIMVNTHYPFIEKSTSSFGRLIEMADIFVLNELEVQKLAGTNRTDIAARKLSESYPGTVMIVTLGGLGSIVISDGQVQFAPTIYNSTIKDPTGAGDTFSGGFLAAYDKTRDPVRSAIVGNTLASIKSSGRAYEKMLGLRFRRIDDLWSYVMSRSHNFGSQKLLSEF